MIGTNHKPAVDFVSTRGCLRRLTAGWTIQLMVDLSLPTLAQRLESVRAAMKLSQAAFAGIAGVSPQAVTKWQTGGAVKDRNLLKIAEAAKVDFIALKYGQHLADASRAPKPRTLLGKEAQRIELALNDDNLQKWIAYGKGLLDAQPNHEPEIIATVRKRSRVKT